MNLHPSDMQILIDLVNDEKRAASSRYQMANLPSDMRRHADRADALDRIESELIDSIDRS